MRGRGGGASVSACGAHSKAMGDSGWTGAVVAVNVTEHIRCV